MFSASVRYSVLRALVPATVLSMTSPSAAMAAADVSTGCASPARRNPRGEYRSRANGRRNSSRRLPPSSGMLGYPTSDRPAQIHTRPRPARAPRSSYRNSRRMSPGSAAPRSSGQNRRARYVLPSERTRFVVTVWACVAAIPAQAGLPPLLAPHCNGPSVIMLSMITGNCYGGKVQERTAPTFEL